MDSIDHLLNNNVEDFRKEIYSELYSKIKEKLQDKKIELASSIYDEPCSDCDETKPK